MEQNAGERLLDWGWVSQGGDPDAATRSERRAQGIVNCTRQWGKSTVTAAKAVHRAYSVAGSLTLVVTPSARQSGEFLRKAEEFVRRLGIRLRGDGDNAMSIALPERVADCGAAGDGEDGAGIFECVVDADR